jgi:hypothetical protein
MEGQPDQYGVDCEKFRRYGETGPIKVFKNLFPIFNRNSLNAGISFLWNIPAKGHMITGYSGTTELIVCLILFVRPWGEY